MSDNWQLGIESSTGHATVVLARGGEVVAEAEVEAARNHSAVMMTPLTEVLNALPDAANLEVILIGTGPGSYNGARAGIAMGQGIAMVRGCPAVGVCSLEGVAAVRDGERCLALGDARRESYFIVPIENGRLSGSTDLLEHGEFVARVENAGERLISFEDVARLRLPEEIAARVELVRPEARLLIAAWNAKTADERVALLEIPPEPFYLRDPYVTTAGKGA